MLQEIRDRAGTWLLTAVLLFVGIPFVFWGINNYFDETGRVFVAKINDVEVPLGEFQRRYQQERARLQQAGADLDQIDDAALKRRVLDAMIQRELLVQMAEDAGFRISDAALSATLQGIEAFHENGAFSKERYERYLRSQYLSAPRFEHDLRRDLMVQQLANGLQQSAFVVPREVSELLRVQEQRRGVRYAVLDAEPFAAGLEIAEDEIAQYYRSHADEFAEPARVRVAYLELTTDRIAEQIEVTEEDLRASYEQEQARYGRPEERRVAHILFAVPADADEMEVEAARKLAESARARLEQGADFAELARAESDDPGSAQSGGDLGFIARGVMDPAFEDAAFALQPGETSEPVRSAFGFHVIRVLEVRPATVKPFEQVRDEVERDYRRKLAETRFWDEAETLNNLSYENPDSLEPAAEALGLKVQESDWFTEQAGTGIAAHEKVRAAAFSDEVRAYGNNSEPIELEPGHVVVLRVKEFEPSRTKPLEAVRDEIRERLRRERAAKLARDAGEALLARARAGEPLEALAQEYDVEIRDAGLIRRDATDPDPRIVQAVFTAPKPGGDGAPQWTSTVLPDGDYVVIAVTEVQEGDPTALPEANRLAMRRGLQQRVAAAEFRAALELRRSRADVVVHEQQL